jgi:hypothetical protein
MNTTQTAARFAVRRLAGIAAVGLALGAFPAACVHAAHKAGRQEATRPAAPSPPAAKGMIVLFSGKAEELASHWVQRGSDKPGAWKLVGDAIQAQGGDLATKQDFSDFYLHLEFKVPYMPDAHGQERGNSGVGLLGRYEIQILDSYGIKEPGSGDCGAVYDQVGPLFNACKPPREWQTYDIMFRAPRFADGKKTEDARVTVLQNGILVQNNQDITRMTGIQFDQYKEEAPSGPIFLQDHGTPIEFRNVWIVPLPPSGPTHYEPR